MHETLDIIPRLAYDQRMTYFDPAELDDATIAAAEPHADAIESACIELIRLNIDHATLAATIATILDNARDLAYDE